MQRTSKQSKNKFFNEKSTISMVFTQIEHNKIPPFAHLQQLAEVGIVNIYLLLDEQELKTIETKLILFDLEKPKTILEYYQSQSNLLNFKVINTGQAKTEEEKLNFYLKNVEKNYLMNIVLCKQSLPWSTTALQAKLHSLTRSTVECSLFPFFSYTLHQKIPSSLKPCSTRNALELLQRPLNPCICYQVGLTDVSNYQWLYNIFVELIALKLEKHNDVNLNKELISIMIEHNNNVSDMEAAEEVFNENHKEIYFYEKTDFLTQLAYTETRKYRDDLQNKFIKIITKLINFYKELVYYDQDNTYAAGKPIGRMMKK